MGAGWNGVGGRSCKIIAAAQDDIVPPGYIGHIPQHTGQHLHRALERSLALTVISMYESTMYTVKCSYNLALGVCIKCSYTRKTRYYVQYIFISCCDIHLNKMTI